MFQDSSWSSMIVTHFPDPGAVAAAVPVLRRIPRPHDMKLRQQDLRCRSCWLPDAWKHPSVKTARKGTRTKSSSPVRAAFFVVLTDRIFPCYIAQRYRFVTHLAASCQASGTAVVLRLKFDIFCQLSKFFLTFSGVTSVTPLFFSTHALGRLHRNAAAQIRSATVTPQPAIIASPTPSGHSSRHAIAPASDAQAYMCLVKI